MDGLDGQHNSGTPCLTPPAAAGCCQSVARASPQSAVIPELASSLIKGAAALQRDIRPRFCELDNCSVVAQCLTLAGLGMLNALRSRWTHGAECAVNPGSRGCFQYMLYMNDQGSAWGLPSR
jgi:hypothetical protein